MGVRYHPWICRSHPAEIQRHIPRQGDQTVIMTKPKLPEDLQKRGRKPIEIDYDMAEKYSSIMCTQSEIASLLGVSLSTLEHDPEFLRIHKKGMEQGKASLRRYAIQVRPRNGKYTCRYGW